MGAVDVSTPTLLEFKTMETTNGVPSPADPSLTEHNRIAVLLGPYGDPYQFATAEIPQPDADEAVVRIDFSGVCHGDVYSRYGGGPAPAEAQRPLVGGHEGIGHVVALGSVEGPFAVGDCVGIAWRAQVCGTCDACKCGAQNFCPSQQVVGMHRNGTFQC